MCCGLLGIFFDLPMEEVDDCGSHSSVGGVEERCGASEDGEAETGC